MPSRRTLVVTGLVPVVALALASPVAASPTGHPSTRSAHPSAVVAPPVRSVGVGSNPIDVAISQRLGNAYVVNDGSISVVNLRTHEQTAEFGTGALHGQNAVALVRGDAQGWVANLQQRYLGIFSTRTSTVVGSIVLGAPSTDVVTSNTPRGQRVYVGLLSTQVLGISTSTRKVVQRIVLPQQPQTLAARPGGRQLWAGGINSGRVYVVSTTTGRIVRTIRVDNSGPVSSIAFSPSGATAWVAGLGGISVVSTSTGRTRRFIPVGSIFGGFPNMGDVALTGSGRYALVENSTFPDAPGRGRLALIDTRSFRIVWRASTGIEPVALAIDTRRDTAYAPNYADDTLSYVRVPA